MNVKEKRKFLKDLCNSVRDSAMSKAAQMPEAWDGIELRHYLADKFEWQASTTIWNDPARARAVKRRYRKYKNEVLVRNL